MSVHKKLMQARVMLQSKKLKKSGQNKFANFEYFELADFLPEIQAIFETIGLCAVVRYATDMATLTMFITWRMPWLLQPWLSLQGVP